MKNFFHTFGLSSSSKLVEQDGIALLNMSDNIPEANICDYVYTNVNDVLKEIKKRARSPTAADFELSNLRDEIGRLEQYTEDHGYNVDALRHDKALEQEYIKYSGSVDARKTFRAVRAIAKLRPLTKGRKLNIAEAFMNRIKWDRCDERAWFKTYFPDSKYSKKVKFLRLARLAALSKLSWDNRCNLGQAVVSWYHESGKSLSQFMAEDVQKFSDELKGVNASYGTHVHIAISDYLRAYERIIGAPLQKYSHCGDADVKDDDEMDDDNHNYAAKMKQFEANQEVVGKYDDNIGIVLEYMAKINREIRIYLGKGHDAQRPLQIDTYFVAPGAAANHMYVIYMLSIRCTCMFQKVRAYFSSYRYMSVPAHSELLI